MSMSTHIKAYIPDTDPEYQKHRKVLLACHQADVSLPVETAEYFGDGYPDENMLDEKLEFSLEENIHYKRYSGSDEHGYEIELSKLPAGVSKIRFYNSW